MKRPASSSAMKKPSGALSVNKTIDKLRLGVSREDLVKGKKTAEDSTDVEETARDKSKGQKYAKMRDSLPEHVIDLVEKESAKAASPREFKTLCINKLFVRDKGGKLQLNLQDHMFTEHKRIYTKRFAKETDRALPPSIMRGLYFHGDDRAFQKAINDGELEAVETGDGKTFYAFTEYKKGKESGSVDQQELKGASKVTKEQAQVCTKAFKAVGWTWTYKDKDAEKIMPGASIPASIMSIVKDATDSQAKLAKEASAIVRQWPGGKADERFSNLKKGHAVTTQNIAKLNHMKEFHELPDGLESTKKNLDELMLTMATHVSEYNELIETCKGLVKAKTK